MPNARSITVKAAIGANRRAAEKQREEYFYLAPWEKMSACRVLPLSPFFAPVSTRAC